MARASRSGVRGLYKSSDGAWYIDLRWRDATTGERKRHSEKLGKINAATAKDRAQRVLEGALSGRRDPTQKASAVGTLRASLDQWLAYCETNGVRSVRDRRTHALTLVRLLGASTRLDSLTPIEVEAMKKKLQAEVKKPALTPIQVEAMKTKLLAEGKKPATVNRHVAKACAKRLAKQEDRRKPATVNRHVATLKNFAKWARVHAGMSTVVATALREDVALVPEHNKRTRYLSDEESATMEANLSGWLRPIAFACKFTGARLGEITGLRWRDVDRAARVVRFERTKTDRTREVAIVDDLARILDALPVGRPDAYVFEVPSRAGAGDAPNRTEQARRRDLASKGWARFCAEHGLVDLHAHDLRHHAATMIRRAGGGLDHVMKVLGHTNIQTAARYAHIDVDSTRSFLELASKR